MEKWVLFVNENKGNDDDNKPFHSAILSSAEYHPESDLNHHSLLFHVTAINISQIYIPEINRPRESLTRYFALFV